MPLCVIVLSVGPEGPRTTNQPPTGCDETEEVIGALVIFQKRVFAFYGFHQKQSNGPTAVSVFSLLCLFVGLVGFCEAMRAAQFDTSSGNGSI